MRARENRTGGWRREVGEEEEGGGEGWRLRKDLSGGGRARRKTTGALGSEKEGGPLPTLRGRDGGGDAEAGGGCRSWGWKWRRALLCAYVVRRWS